MTSSCIPLSLVRLSPDADSLASVHCTKCESALSFHQPDLQRPHRLLAVCCECEMWYMLDLVAGVMVSLPRVDPEPANETPEKSEHRSLRDR